MQGLVSPVLIQAVDFGRDLVYAREHREIMAKASLDSRRGPVERVLIFLVESGTIYCLIWVLRPSFLQDGSMLTGLH